MKYIHTNNAPQAIGPYSQAIFSNGWLFSSGQIALDATTMNIVKGGVKEQTIQVLQNLEAVLIEAGLSKDDVIKTTLYVQNMEDFVEINDIYASFFGNHKPARSTVEVSRLPKDVLIEIDVVARGE